MCITLSAQTLQNDSYHVHINQIIKAALYLNPILSMNKSCETVLLVPMEII